MLLTQERVLATAAGSRGGRRVRRPRRGRRRPAEQRRLEPLRTPGEPRVRHLHLGVDRPAEGRPGRASSTSPGCLTATEEWFGFGPDDAWLAVPLVRVRLLRLGALGRAALRRPAGRRAVLDDALARRARVAARRRAGDRAQRDADARSCSAQEELVRAGESLALRLVVFGGEALHPSSLRPWFARFGTDGPRLVNMYGITETTVHVTYRPLVADDLRRATRVRSDGRCPTCRCTSSMRI